MVWDGSPLRYSCLGNPMDRGAWWVIVHGVTESRMQLSDYTHTHTHTHGVRCRGHDSFFPNRNVCFLHHCYSNGLVFHHLIKLVSFSKLSYSQMSLSLNLLFCSIYLSTIIPRLYCLTILALYMEIFGEIINLTNLFCLIFMCKEMTFGFKKYG